MNQRPHPTTGSRAMRLSLLLAIPVAIMLTGCGDSTLGTVSGTVTLDGRPLDQGLVVFEDRDRGVSVNTAIGSDGSFVVETYDQTGLAPGEYAVAVKPGALGDGETPLVESATTTSRPENGAIPAWYGSTRTSGLVVTVTPGENHIPLELSSQR